MYNIIYNYIKLLEISRERLDRSSNRKWNPLLSVIAIGLIVLLTLEALNKATPDRQG